MKFRNIFSLIFISFLTLVVPGAVANDDASDEAIDFCNIINNFEFSASQINKISGKSVGTVEDVGFDYKLFTDSDKALYNENYVSLYKDGSFYYYFEECYNKCFFTYGLNFNEAKTHERIGHLYADYRYYVYSSDEEYTYIGIHGWGRDSDNSLIEYYIVDSWYNYKKEDIWSDKKNIGSITIDGAEYNVYQIKNVKKDENSDTTHTQIFSVRKNRKNDDDCGTIDITEHFRQWEELGIKLGIIYDAKFIIESKSLSDKSNPDAEGFAYFYYAKIRIKPIKHKCIIWNEKN